MPVAPVRPIERTEKKNYKNRFEFTTRSSPLYPTSQIFNFNFHKLIDNRKKNQKIQKIRATKNITFIFGKRKRCRTQ